MAVRTTFFGTSSVHVTDDVSGILVDGFFSRPPLLRVALGRPIAPDPGVIAATLAEAVSRISTRCSSRTPTTTTSWTPRRSGAHHARVHVGNRGEAAELDEGTLESSVERWLIQLWQA